MRTEKISYLSPDWFSFDNHVLVGGGDKEVHNSSQLLMINIGSVLGVLEGLRPYIRYKGMCHCKGNGLRRLV